MGFNDNLKLLLKDRNLKQADLCRMTGIQTSLMSDYLGGKKSPTIGNAILIADALNISLDILVGKDTSPSVRYDTFGSEVPNMSFAEQLKRARIAQGLTQQQVADLLGITNSTYCGYETGKRQPDVEKIKQLARALNTSGDVLLETGFASEQEAESPKSEKLNEALEVFKSLNPNFQDYALQQIKKLAELQEKK